MVKQKGQAPLPAREGRSDGLGRLASGERVSEPAQLALEPPELLLEALPAVLGLVGCGDVQPDRLGEGGGPRPVVASPQRITMLRLTPTRAARLVASS
jgi:hypothetical protein